MTKLKLEKVSSTPPPCLRQNWKKKKKKKTNNSPLILISDKSWANNVIIFTAHISTSILAAYYFGQYDMNGL